MSSVWVTSDTHFWHANIIHYCGRPFKEVTEMNEILIKNWNETVAPNEVVYHLGDFALAARAVETIVPRLNGRINLILGNHDFPHPAHARGRKEDSRERWTKIYLDYGFNSVQLEESLNIPEVANFRLFHLPYQDPTDLHQNGSPRHFKERLKDDGVPLLCGHVHNRWLFKITASGTPQLNIGVDAPGAPWRMRPASMEEIKKIYLEKICTKEK